MKRDMDLIRKILFFIEEQPPEWEGAVNIDGVDTDEVAYNLAKMEEAGLIKAHVKYINRTSIPFVHTQCMTNLGHEFLDLARKNTVWEATKSKLTESAIGLSVSVTMAYMQAKVSEALGVHIGK